MIYGWPAAAGGACLIDIDTDVFYYYCIGMYGALVIWNFDAGITLSGLWRDVLAPDYIEFNYLSGSRKN
jgi:hypothetical protein